MKKFRCSNCGSMDFEVQIQLMTPYLDAKIREGKVVEIDDSKMERRIIYLINFFCASCGDCIYAGEYETPEEVPLLLGSLDKDVQLTPKKLHIALEISFESTRDNDDSIIEL